MNFIARLIARNCMFLLLFGVETFVRIISMKNLNDTKKNLCGKNVQD